MKPEGKFRLGIRFPHISGDLNCVAAMLDKKPAHCGRTGRGIINRRRVKPLISISLLVVAGLWSAVLPTNAQVNVTQHHNHDSRDGLISIPLSRRAPQPV
jgi:hypothetical protein